MKKLLWLLIPLLFLITILFFFQGRDFSFNGFLLSLSEMQFDATLGSLQRLRDTLLDIESYWKSFYWPTEENPGDLLYIVSMLKNFINFFGAIMNFIGSIASSIALFLVEGLHNVFQVLTYLLGITDTPYREFDYIPRPIFN